MPSRDYLGLIERLSPDQMRRKAARASKGFGEGAVDELKRLIDIVDLIGGEYGVMLDPMPNGDFRSGCPFPDHPDRTPSFDVNPEKQVYLCRGCGRGGDAIAFVMEMEGVTFVQAVYRLAEIAGYSLEGGEDAALDRLVRSITQAIEGYLERGEGALAESPYPGGMGEVAFLRLVTERLWDYEKACSEDAAEREWVEAQYRAFDALDAAGDQAGMARFWSRLGPAIRERRRRREVVALAEETKNG